VAEHLQHRRRSACHGEPDFRMRGLPDAKHLVGKTLKTNAPSTCFMRPTLTSVQLNFSSGCGQ